MEPSGVPGLSDRDWLIHLTEMDICKCEGCGGHLEGRTCQSCGCQHWVQGPTRLDRNRYAVGVPNVDGRCRVGTQWLADWNRELDQQAARRRRAWAEG